jgi:hypothetical protein
VSFTQTTWDQEGYAIRDPDSTTYVAAIETAGEFGPRIYLEAWNRGWKRAEKKVVIGDGAEWIWHIAGDHFPGAVQIVDIFHARRFTIHYTPTHGSWLNQAEIESASSPGSASAPEEFLTWRDCAGRFRRGIAG